MRSYWRSESAVVSDHGAWLRRIDRKNRRQGTSAPTLAAVWAGPVELFSALRQHSVLTDLVVTEIVVEAQSAVDEYSGPRNHDLVVRGRLPNGDGVVVCVEAKAGEDLGPTVAQQAKAAKAAKERADQTAASTGKPTTSNAIARLDGLLQRFVPDAIADEDAQGLRYQLLTALAGTINEAAHHDARHAVLMVHEFLTDERPDDKILLEHEQDLRKFCTTVFDMEPPDPDQVPWCVEAPALQSAPGLTLYLARAITDLRRVTLEAPGAEPSS